MYVLDAGRAAGPESRRSLLQRRQRLRRFAGLDVLVRTLPCRGAAVTPLAAPPPAAALLCAPRSFIAARGLSEDSAGGKSQRRQRQSGRFIAGDNQATETFHGCGGAREKGQTMP